MLRKSQCPAPPPLRQETVNVPELQGDVVVRGMLLRDRLNIAISDGYGRMAQMLAACVLVAGDDGELVPVYSADEWERWGAANYAAALMLWAKAREFSDLDGDDAKKNSATSSSTSPAA